jgi:DNA-binding beta-propeller fold protein YncE
VGSQGAHPGQFNCPRALALTPDDAFLLVADTLNRRVVVLRATDGAWVRQLKGPPGMRHQLPVGVAVVPSTGQVLVSDYFQNQVIQFQSIEDDSVVGTLGTGQGSGPTEFDNPFGLAILDGSCCPPVRLSYQWCSDTMINLPTVRALVVVLFSLQEGPVTVVADRNNHRLALWHLRDGTVWRHLGSKGTQPGQFTTLRAVAVTGSGALVVTDEHRVQVLMVDGAVLCVLDPSAVEGVGLLGSQLYGVAVFPGTNEILVTDTDNHRVVALTCTSDWSALVDARACGSQGNQLGQLNHPVGIVVTAAGAVWVGEYNNQYHRLILMH